MKRIITLAAALCLALTVSACGQTSPAGSSAGTDMSAGASSSAAPASSGTPTESVPETDRDKQATLSMEVEGQTEEVPATLYEGEGYSIYIPDEGWVKTTGDLPKGACDQWVAAANPDVTLTVCNSEADEQWAASQKHVIDCVQESHVYMVYTAYPDEAAEGFGARLPVIAGTVALTA